MWVLGESGVFCPCARAGRRGHVLLRDVEVDFRRPVETDFDVNGSVGDGDLALGAQKAVPRIRNVRDLGRARRVEESGPVLKDVLDGESSVVPVAARLEVRRALLVAHGRKDARRDPWIGRTADEDGGRSAAEQRVVGHSLFELVFDVFEVLGDGVGFLFDELATFRALVALDFLEVLVESHRRTKELCRLQSPVGGVKVSRAFSRGCPSPRSAPDSGCGWLPLLPARRRRPHAGSSFRYRGARRRRWRRRRSRWEISPRGVPSRR